MFIFNESLSLLGVNIKVIIYYIILDKTKAYNNIFNQHLKYTIDTFYVFRKIS
jgi:hypothetical protein